MPSQGLRIDDINEIFSGDNYIEYPYYLTNNGSSTDKKFAITVPFGTPHTKQSFNIKAQGKTLLEALLKANTEIQARITQQARTSNQFYIPPNSQNVTSLSQQTVPVDINHVLFIPLWHGFVAEINLEIKTHIIHQKLKGLCRTLASLAFKLNSGKIIAYLND